MAADLLEAQTGLQYYTLSFIGPMSLKCAVDLGVPSLLRLMRVLTHSNFFSATVVDDNETVYSLTPLSRLLVNDNNATASLTPWLLQVVDPVIMTPFHSMATWFRGDTATPFQEAHGCGIWEKANESPDFNRSFNAAMASDSNFLVDALVKECGQVFKGLKSLVDVGGGTGSVARAISEAFPDVKCSVLELAHVIKTLPKDAKEDTVEFIIGDMFEHIPTADGVLLKWMLHITTDEECVKILKRCKEAIPAKEEGGKVIIIDIVVGSKNSHPKSMETQLYWDMLMLAMVPGEEREEHKWKKIFTDAGFTDYKITPSLGLRSIIELYP